MARYIPCLQAPHLDEKFQEMEQRVAERTSADLRDVVGIKLDECKVILCQ